MSFLTSTASFLGRALPGTRAHRLLILIYHRVHARPDPMFPGEVDAARFTWQMGLLKRHCHPLPLADAVVRLKSDDLPPRAIAVTFDDGYADNATVALPILRRHGIHATFFVAPGFLDGGRMWNDSIIETIRLTPGATLDLTGFGLGVVALATDAERGRIADAVIKVVKHLHPTERQRRVDLLRESIGVPLPLDLMMTSVQLRQLVDAGMEIGAHTMTHPILRTLETHAAVDEIQSGRAALEHIIGRRVRAFAYPNGRPGEDYTERDRDVVASLGFDFAASTRWGAATWSSDVLQLPRFTPWDRSPARWLARLLLTFNSTE